MTLERWKLWSWRTSLNLPKLRMETTKYRHDAPYLDKNPMAAMITRSTSSMGNSDVKPRCLVRSDGIQYIEMYLRKAWAQHS